MRAGSEVGAVVTKDMAKAGVGILAGCDSMIAGFCVHDELAAMVRGGMTHWLPCRRPRSTPPGTLVSNRPLAESSGRRADLVLLDADPQTDITNVGHIRAVVVAGRFLDRTELDKVLAQVEVALSQLNQAAGRYRVRRIALRADAIIVISSARRRR